MADIQQDIQAFFTAKNIKYEKCLHGDLTCDKNPIRAHSIQNKRVLDLLHTDGHVLMPAMQFNQDREPSTIFERVGRNEASTFSGLCSEHDNALFKAIDTEPLNVDDCKHLRQLGYRAVIREMHTDCEWSARLYSIHEGWVKSGAIPKNAHSPALDAVAVFDEKAFRAYNFRKKVFDGNAALDHLIITISDMAPVLAASSFFSIGRDESGEAIGATLNVVPIDEKTTVAVLTCPKEQADKVQTALAKLYAAEGKDLRYQLSRLIIQRVENFVLAPKQYSSWSADKQKRILDEFERSLKDPEALQDHDDLMLFIKP